MTTPLRSLTLLFALYIISDFVNPALPGVFSFENDGLFVPGAVAGDPNTNRCVPRPPPSSPSVAAITISGSRRYRHAPEFCSSAPLAGCTARLPNRCRPLRLRHPKTTKRALSTFFDRYTPLR